MNFEEIELRLKQIEVDSEAEGADLDALETETRNLVAMRDELRKKAQEEEETRQRIADGEGETTETFESEEKKMDNMEVRNTEAYINAYAEYIKSGDDRECRSLLTKNVTGGYVPVPEMVDEIVRHAWESDEILARVRKTAFRGNLKVAFELSATAAGIHTEGDNALDEETLTLGIVNMIPSNIKKWIRISDEVVAMGGEAFLRYVYEELAYRIAHKLASTVVTTVAGLSATSSATAVGAKQVSSAPSLTVIPNAFANLSDEAKNPVIIMNKLTYANFIAAKVAGNFENDPFMGLPVLFNSSLPAYDTASAGNVYAIVGDLNGVQVNYPEGEGVVIKYDDLTDAEADLVKIVGRQYCAVAATAPFRFTNIKKA